MIRRILALVKKEFLHLKNDWWLPVFMILGGALELLLIGWATSRPISNLPLMVWDMDQTQPSRNLVISIENTDVFSLTDPPASMADIEDQMDRGNVNAALIIPRGFANELIKPGGEPVLQVILNGAESIPAREAQRAIEGVTRSLGEKITIERLGIDPDQFKGFDFSLRVWFNEGLNEAYYTTPAELALMLEFTILLFSALTFSREREFGTLEQLLVMPFSSLEIIIGKSIPVILVGLADFTLMLGVVHFAFKVPIRGSLILLFGLALVYIMVELAKGWLTIVRGILLKGSGIVDILPSVLILLVLGSVIGFFSLRYIRKALD
jgi:ABC-2 type transport system permease protein